MTQLSILSFMKKKSEAHVEVTSDLNCDNENTGNNDNFNALNCNKRDKSTEEDRNSKKIRISGNIDEDIVKEEELIECFGEEWFGLLREELSKPYFIECFRKVRERRRIVKVYPPEKDMFQCFKTTPVSKISVVIIGQDPYHQPGQAMGLCFSVPKGVPIPPSLKNIYKEIGKGTPSHGDLTSWAEQGVFLLNSLLSVEEGKPMSHKDYVSFIVYNIHRTFFY
ncbi:uracil-DNA glycosylase [Cryptosporidium bovis]|uniref:uracil-DNA glycosylase n=1 Tax=Cryptosporidium bovis TaxID=310047 RepID=UPI00351A576F|nr:uracil-DNA glycosylase [Cryptosporidium bovis]